MKIYGDDFAIVHAMGIHCTCDIRTDWDGNHDEYCLQRRVLEITKTLVARMAKLATEQERERVCGIVAGMEFVRSTEGWAEIMAGADTIAVDATRAAIVAKIREG